VSETAIETLRQTRPWVIFMSVITFIGAGFTLIGAISMFFMAAVIPMAGMSPGVRGADAAMGGMFGAMYGGMGVLYLVMAAGYIYPAIKLWSFGSAIGRLLSSRSTVDLEDALLHQKAYWKFLSIAIIVFVTMCILGFLVMMVLIAAGVSQATHGG
jgi:hypothetical protein